MLQDLVSNIDYDEKVDKISKLQKNLLVKSDFHVVTLKNKNKNYASNLRIEPREVNIFDFEVETHYTFTIKISNSAKDMQKLLVKPPKSSYLTINESCKKYLQGFELAPGLSVDIKLDLFIPVLSKSSSSCTSNFMDSGKEDNISDQQWYQDDVIVIIDYHYPIKIPIKAYPPEPQLSFIEYIDFGKQMFVPIEEKIPKSLSYSSNDLVPIKKDILLSERDQTSKLSSSTKELNNKSSSSTTSINQTPYSIHLKYDKYSEEDWKWAIEKTFTITNTGKVRAKFNINYDENLPIKVFPTSGILDPINDIGKSFYIIPSVKNDNSIDITIKYLPCDVGILNETLYVSIEEDVKCLNSAFNFNYSNSSKNKVKTIMVHANVLKHSLTILDHNEEELNVQNIKFKSVYYSQKQEIKAYIYNNDKKEIKFSIINANVLSPLLPPKKIFDFQNEIFNEQEQKTCISVSPYEGVIKPNQFFPIKFNFAPKLPPIIKGFKSIKPVYPSKKYVTDLTLKIENADNNKPEYYPINFQLTGEGTFFKFIF